MRFKEKLVRDKIPDIIKKSGRVPHYITLSNLEYKKELKLKLKEEILELCSAETGSGQVEELADVFEVIFTIRRVFKINCSNSIDPLSSNIFLAADFSPTENNRFLIQENLKKSCKINKINNLEKLLYLYMLTHQITPKEVSEKLIQKNRSKGQFLKKIKLLTIN